MLAVKDRALAHNPLAAIYNSDIYSRRLRNKIRQGAWPGTLVEMSWLSERAMSEHRPLPGHTRDRTFCKNQVVGNPA